MNRKEITRRKFVKCGTLGVIGAIGAATFPSIFVPRKAEAFCLPPSLLSEPLYWQGRKLALGSRGNLVRELQIRIGGYISISSPIQKYLKVSGIFDMDTVIALKNFQRLHGLDPTGEYSEKEAEVMSTYEKQDRSTKNYNFSDFYSGDGKQFSGGTEPNEGKVKENVRRLMWRIEAMNKKLGTVLHIKSGFRSISHNNNVGGVINSYHTFGCAADVTLPEYMSGNDGFTCATPDRGISPQRVEEQTAVIQNIANVAKSCGFSGVREYGPLSRPIPFVHVDIRMEVYPNHWDRKWWWPEPQDNCKDSSDGD